MMSNFAIRYVVAPWACPPLSHNNLVKVPRS